MSLYNNSPTFSYISATGITVIFNDNLHTVYDFNTNKKYIYWNTDTPNIFKASNVMPETSQNQFLVLVNENGTAIEVPNEGLQVFFDGNSVENIRDRIWGIYDTNDEFKDKFVTVEQNINGINVSVGELQKTDNEIKTNISNIEQNAEKIDLSVKEVIKNFNDDKDARELRDNFYNSIIDLQSALGVFKSEFNDISKDSSISSDEKVEINEHKNIITQKKTSVDTFVDKIIQIAIDKKLNQDKIKVENAKRSLNETHTYFINTINNTISDNVITPSDKTLIIDAFAKYTLKINELKNVCENVILLGVGGSIIEQFSNIILQSDKIEQEVAIIEDGVKTNASNITQTAESIRQEVSSINTDLEGKINKNTSLITQTANSIRSEVNSQITSLDGKISNNKSLITQTANQIRSEVSSVNKDLSGKISNNTTLITQTANSIRSEVSSINTELSGKISNNTSLIQQTANSIALKVSKDDIISSINLSPESVIISSDKVNLSGYVTFTNLSTSGQTEIDGGNIKTNSLTADKVAASHFYGHSLTTVAKNLTSSHSHCVVESDGIKFYSPSKQAGYISYDSHGDDTEESAANRLWLRSLGNYALKIQSSGDMSLEANGGWNNVWVRGNKVAFNVGSGGFWINNNRIDTNFTAVFG